MEAEPLYSRLKRLDALHRAATRWPVVTAPLRFASYAAYRGLELLLGGRHPHNRVVAQAGRLARRRRQPAAAPPRRRVLFFTVRGWFVHVAGEAVLAEALRQRGADSEFFLCGGPLAQCDFKPGTDPRVTRPLCWRCSGFPRRLLAALGAPVFWLDDLLADGEREEASRRVAGLADDRLGELRELDLPLLEIVQPSVQRSLLRGDLGGDPASVAVLRGFLESAILYARAAERLLERRRPDTVVMTNGLFFAERILLELALRRGVHAVTYERGMPLQSILFDHDRPVIRFDLDEPWRQARERPLDEEEAGRLDDYLLDRSRGRVGVLDLWPQMEADREALRRRLGLDARRPLAILFTNILWDSAVYGRHVAFADMFEWIVASVRWFGEHPQAQLVVRVHPSEVRIPLAASRDRVGDRLAASLPENVRVVAADDPASSYALLSLADAALVYTSTIGLEAALRGTPVVVAGRTHYRGRGFTIDPESPDEHDRALEAALGRGGAGAGRRQAGQEVELARRYAYLFFFRFMKAFPWVVDAPRAARRLTFEDPDELAPGRDPELDAICDGILDRTPFVTFDRAT